MTREEFATFTMALKTYFTKEKLLPNTQAMELWYGQLKNLPIAIAQMALQKWVATNKWSPSISELFSMVEKIHWEAYEITSNRPVFEMLSDAERKRYEWVYEVTRPYKMAKLAEPSIQQLMSGKDQLEAIDGQRLQLEKGEW